MNNSYPTVATIIGCPEELKSAGGLVATPLVIEEEMSMPEPSVQQLLPSDTSGIKDPVQKAIVDNILGKNSNKILQEKHKCELCNIEVNGKAALLTHLSGSRHAKRVKEENLNKEPQSPYIEFLELTKMYHCKLCNATLNARVQIMAHLQGSKHRAKLDGTEKLDSAPQPPNSGPPATVIPALPNLKKKEPTATNPGGGTPAIQLFCSTCKIYTNSELQLQQHTSSKKHLNKLNNIGTIKTRPAPYSIKSPKAGAYRPMNSNLNNFGGRQAPFGSNSGQLQYQQRRVNSSYNNPSYGTYSSLSSSFVSSGVYGGGSGYNNQPNYNRHYNQTHTYG